MTDLQHQHRISLTLAGQHSKMAGRFRSAHEVLTGLRGSMSLYARSSGTHGPSPRIWRTPPRSTIAVSIAMAAVSDVVEADTIADAAEALRASPCSNPSISLELLSRQPQQRTCTRRRPPGGASRVGRYATRLRRVKSEAQGTLPSTRFHRLRCRNSLWVCTIPALTDEWSPSLQIVQAVISLSLVRLVVGEMSVSEEHLSSPLVQVAGGPAVVNQLNEHEKTNAQAVTDTAHLLSNCQDWQLPPMPRLGETRTRSA